MQLYWKNSCAQETPAHKADESDVLIRDEWWSRWSRRWRRWWIWLWVMMDIILTLITPEEKKAMIKNSKDGTKREKTVEIRRWGKKKPCTDFREWRCLKRESERESGRESESGREERRRDNSVCPSWTQFCDRLTDSAREGRINLRQSHRHPEVNSKMNLS